jgi:hypothetical protein
MAMSKTAHGHSGCCISRKVQVISPFDNDNTIPLKRIYDMWKEGDVSFEVLVEAFNQAFRSVAQATRSTQALPDSSQGQGPE